MVSGDWKTRVIFLPLGKISRDAMRMLAVILRHTVNGRGFAHLFLSERYFL